TYDKMVEPLAIGVHVGKLAPEQREISEHRRHVRQIERDRLLGEQTAVAVEVIVAVSKAVAGKQHPLARIEAPPGRAQVTDYRLDRHPAASAEIHRVVLVHRPHAMLVFRKCEVIIADVAAQYRLCNEREAAHSAAPIRALL